MNFNIKSIFYVLMVLVLASCGKGCGSKTALPLSIAIQREPTTLNPILGAGDPYSGQIANRHLYMSLLDNDPTTLELIPYLAKANPTITFINDGPNKGGVAYEYEILDEAVWDNGKPITAADYIFTIKAILNPKTNANKIRSYFDFIKDVQIDANNPKKFKVIESRQYIKGAEVTGTIYILPEYIFDPQGLMKDFLITDLSDKKKATTLATDAKLQQFTEGFNNVKTGAEKAMLVGCGPYNVDSWTPAQSIVLKKKANWWGSALAAKNMLFKAVPEQIVYKLNSNPAAFVAELQAGTLDVMNTVPPPNFIEFQKDDKFKEKYNLETPVAPYWTFIGMNNKNPKLEDKKVRRALAHLCNVKEVIEKVYKGLGLPVVSPFAPAKEYYLKDVAPMTYDVEAAKQLLTVAGWADTNGNGIVDKKINGTVTDLTLKMAVANGSPGEAIATIFKEWAKAAGVNIEVDKKEATVFRDDLKKRNMELYYSVSGTDPGLDDPEQFWHSNSDTPDGSNFVGFANPEADKLIDQIVVTLDKTKRNELYQQFQKLLLSEQVVIYLVQPKLRMAYNKRISPVTFYGLSPTYFEQYFEIK